MVGGGLIKCWWTPSGWKRAIDYFHIITKSMIMGKSMARGANEILIEWASRTIFSKDIRFISWNGIVIAADVNLADQVRQIRLEFVARRYANASKRFVSISMFDFVEFISGFSIENVFIATHFPSFLRNKKRSWFHHRIEGREKKNENFEKRNTDIHGEEWVQMLTESSASICWFLLFRTRYFIKNNRNRSVLLHMFITVGTLSNILHTLANRDTSLEKSDAIMKCFLWTIRQTYRICYDHHQLNRSPVVEHAWSNYQPLFYRPILALNDQREWETNERVDERFLTEKHSLKTISIRWSKPIAVRCISSEIAALSKSDS